MDTKRLLFLPRDAFFTAAAAAAVPALASTPMYIPGTWVRTWVRAYHPLRNSVRTFGYPPTVPTFLVQGRILVPNGQQAWWEDGSYTQQQQQQQQQQAAAA